MAKNHNITDFMKPLEEIMRRDTENIDEETFNEIEEYSKDSKTLLPLRPVFFPNDEKFCMINFLNLSFIKLANQTT
jgi:hypothetical protein